MTKRSKATIAQKIKRVSEVYNMLLSGKSRTQILQIITRKYKVCESSCDKYISEARRKLKRYIEKDMTTGLRKRLARRELMFSKAFEDGKIDLCLEIEKDTAKIEGLYTEKIKVDNTNVVSDFSNMKNEDLEEQLKLYRGINDQMKEKINNDKKVLKQ